MSIQAWIDNGLQVLQQEYHLSYLFISHDMKVVEHLVTRIAVMSVGKLAERAPEEILFNDPTRPSPWVRLSANLVAYSSAQRNRVILSGDVPSLRDPPPGCRLSSRRPEVMGICKTTESPLILIDRSQPHHTVRCYLSSSSSPMASGGMEPWSTSLLFATRSLTRSFTQSTFHIAHVTRPKTFPD